MRVAVDWGFVGAGLDLLRFLRGEWIGSAVPDVYLQLQQDLERALELHFAVETIKKKNNNQVSLLSSTEAAERLNPSKTYFNIQPHENSLRETAEEEHQEKRK